MFDFVSLENYTHFYYYVLLVIVLVTFINSRLLLIDDKRNLLYVKAAGTFLLLFTTLFMGLRPISGYYFGDMQTYAQYFYLYQSGIPIMTDQDAVFHSFMYFCAQVMTVHNFFLLCAIIYVVPLFFVCKKWFPKYWFYAFLLVVISFSFWSYGTNGIRNGIAGSIFIFALSRDRRLFQILLMLIAVGIHKTMLLPVVAYCVTYFYNRSKSYLIFWFICIPLSLIGGTFFENLFANIGFEDSRINYLIQGNINNDDFSSTGFRWDFLLYSFVPIFIGSYYILKRKFEDEIYVRLFNIYIIANSFWILVIRANFSNRFAYLSWFMMAFVIIYPILNVEESKLYKITGYTILLYFGFTFFMNVILLSK